MRFHVNKKGEAKPCEAEVRDCPVGGEHFATEEAAREAYESDMKDLAYLRGNHRKPAKVLTPQEKLRANFFTEKSQNAYTLIDVETGTVFGTNAIVMEYVDDEDVDRFLDSPNDFTEVAKYKAIPLYQASDISGYKNAIILEPDTETVVSASGVYAIDISNEIIDFEAILDDSSAAADTAEAQGFALWP